MRRYLYNLATDKSTGLIPSVFKAFLFILSLIYGLAVRILVCFKQHKPYRLPCKVIGVGNITLGGTGKTSLVEYLTRYLKNQGHKVAVLSRGYKRRGKAQGLRVKGYEAMGDEPYMLARKLGDIPVIVDPDRIRAAKQAIRDYAVDTVILDDAFQQWRIKKDLEIVSVDATRAFGNGHLLPRGILREPLSALKRTDLIVLTKTNLNPDIKNIKDVLSQINPSALLIESIHSPVGFYEIGKSQEFLKADTLRGKTVTLFSGIGDPDSFENLIASLNIRVGLSFKFPDHHHYTLRDLENIIQVSHKKSIDTVITTEKDAVKLEGLRLVTDGLRLLVLRIALKILKDEERFTIRLLKLYNS